MPDQIDVIIADLDLFTEREIVALALNVDANLRESGPIGTPVDTGWARANWVPSIGTPSQIDGRAPEGVRKAGGPDGDPAFEPLAASEVAARAEIQTKGLNDVLHWKTGEGTIFVTNNVPYIQPLNNGTSTQSPRGFVQAAVALAVRQTQSRGQNKADRLAAAQTTRVRSGKAANTIRAQAFQRARDRKSPK